MYLLLYHVSSERIARDFFFFFFSLISLTADEPHHYHPACGHKGSSHLSPVLALWIFYPDASSALLQLVNQWLNFTYSRSHAFRYERKNTNPTLVRIELTTSALVCRIITGPLGRRSMNTKVHIYHTVHILYRCTCNQSICSCKWRKIFLEAQYGFRVGRSTDGMIYVVRGVQELAREKDLPLFMCFIDLQKAYDSVDRSLLWKVLARYGVPAKLISIIRQFHDGMRACVRLDSGETSEWFAVEQGLRQGCVIAPDLFNIFFVAVLTVAFDRFSIDKAVLDDFVRVVARGDLTKDAAKRVLWAMLYADDAGIASQSQASLEKMMTAIVEVCAAFGLIVSEKKTVTMHMRPPTMKAEAVAVEAAGQRYSQVDTFVYLGSTISSVGDVGPEIKRRTGYAWNCFLKYSRAVYDNPYIAVADKVRFLKAEVLEVMLYGCVTWTLSPGDFDKLREAHRGMLLRCLNAYTSTRAAPDYHMLSYLEVLLRTDCECIEATVMKRILHYAGRVARMHDDRLPNIVMRGEMVGGKRKRGQPAKRLEHRVTEYCTAFGIDPKCWMRAAQDAPEWYRKVETGAEVFMSAWSTKRVNETNARHAKELFATLPFELP